MRDCFLQEVQEVEIKVVFILDIFCFPFQGAKKVSFTVGQAVTNIYWPESHFYQPEKIFSLAEKKSCFALSAATLQNFHRVTAKYEWLTCILDILEFRNTFYNKKKKNKKNGKNGVETVKPKFSMDTLNDSFDNAKSCQ